MTTCKGHNNNCRVLSYDRNRYYGSFRYKVREAIRATTAAPTFFAPLMINGALYSDGALLCNNPSAVAFHEAKVCRLFSSLFFVFRMFYKCVMGIVRGSRGDALNFPGLSRSD